MKSYSFEPYNNVQSPKVGLVQNGSGIIKYSGYNAGNITLSVYLNTTSASPVTVNVNTIDGTAHAGADYTAIDQDVTIPAGSSSASFNVSMLGNPSQNSRIFFNVIMTDPANAGYGDMRGVPVFVDPAPNLFMFDWSHTQNVKSNAGGVTVTISKNQFSSSLPCSVSYSTRDGTAIAGESYAAQSGTINFLSGDASKPITITLLNNQYPTARTFYIDLSSPVNCTIGAPAYATITVTMGPPTTTFTGTPTSGVEPLTVTFDSSASTGIK
jgi:hypothetical protein